MNSLIPQKCSTISVIILVQNLKDMITISLLRAALLDHHRGGFTFLFLPLDRCDLVLFLLFPIYVFQLRVKELAA